MNPTAYTYNYYTVAGPYVPTGPGTVTVPMPATTATGQLAVAQFAMHKNNAGLGASLPLLFDDSNCCNGGNQTYIRASSTNKFTIGH